ncbi:chorismate mutase [Methanobrevibacter arboriphilus JCM 13429 = DSM 1125]|uniref:Chorismate mutase n=1 Tax=Methanobrevibacter arboriphilus JCM 13429 = DSM 1125 TaxID=1300164 RepID=A0A1V6N3R5_METAZ|nr:chorismate mutase [Methanobrevibacter arboriphilus]OQD59304.1 chorismate mutase [Methanobrevibacter arboriphilus JCM 13429 = DSM 1125]
MEHQSLNKERFKDLENSKKILEDSRREIDQIDSELIDLIQKRTSLAKDIVMAKIALDMDIYDESREKLIYEKIIKIANDKDLNENIRNSIIEIVNILTSLSKSEQKKIIDKNL